jgi:hypothetical protein
MGGFFKEYLVYFPNKVKVHDVIKEKPEPYDSGKAKKNNHFQVSGYG